MATPSNKSPEMTDFLEANFGRTTAITNDTCTSCGGKAFADRFDSDLSRKEYSISGLCQRCQDAVFGRQTK